MRKNIFVAAAVVMLTGNVPASALTLYTMGIENYGGNGSPSDNTYFACGNARTTGSTAQSYGWTWQWYSENSQVTNSNFYVPGSRSSSNRPWITYVDMAVYHGGHSSEDGPWLGANTGYNKDNAGNVVMTREHYNSWSQGQLKWFVNTACLMLRFSNPSDIFNSGQYAMNRYLDCFTRVNSGPGAYPDGTLHAIFAACSDTYGSEFCVGKDFLDKTLGQTSMNTGPAWMDAQYWQGYVNPRHGGICYWVTGIMPAVLNVYTFGTDPANANVNYYNENLKSPYADPYYYWWNTGLFTALTFTYARDGSPKFHLVEGQY